MHRLLRRYTVMAARAVEQVAEIVSDAAVELSESALELGRDVGLIEHESRKGERKQETHAGRKGTVPTKMEVSRETPRAARVVPDGEIAANGSLVIWIPAEVADKYAVTSGIGAERAVSVGVPVVKRDANGLSVVVDGIGASGVTHSLFLQHRLMDHVRVTFVIRADQTVTVSVREWCAEEDRATEQVHRLSTVTLRPRDWMTFDGAFGETVVVTLQSRETVAAGLSPQPDTGDARIFGSLVTPEFS